MGNRELMLMVNLIKEDLEKDETIVELKDSAIVRYVKTEHEMRCYHNVSMLILNRNTPTEIRVVTDIYINDKKQLWIKAKDINQDFEFTSTKVLYSLEQIREKSPYIQRPLIIDTSVSITVPGHTDTWSVIATNSYKGKKVFLLENEKYGEDTNCLIVDENINVLVDNVWNGFDDLEYLED